MASWATRSRPWHTAPRPWRARCSKVRGPGEHMLAHLRRHGSRYVRSHACSGQRAAMHTCGKPPALLLRSSCCDAPCVSLCCMYWGGPHQTHIIRHTEGWRRRRRRHDILRALCTCFGIMQVSRVLSWCGTASAWRACTSTRASLRWCTTCWLLARPSPPRPLTRRHAGRQAPGGTFCA